jgi:hypothetical protein
MSDWRFKIVSVGWNCAKYLHWTFESVEMQEDQGYDFFIVDDATGKDDLEGPERMASTIAEWAAPRSNWNYRINTERLYGVRNQYEAIELMDPQDDDVIVFLDLDGDRLAQPNTLSYLRAVYDEEQPLVTFGSYRPIPDEGTSIPARQIPLEMLQNNGYRDMLRQIGSECFFNHLRTMRGKVFRNIPLEYFKFRETGEWYAGGQDYIFMTPAIELAGTRVRFIPEVLLWYNHDNPFAMFRHMAQDSTDAVLDANAREKLQPL